jgi:tetratricopeptide (TPR) repeat protein
MQRGSSWSAVVIVVSAAVVLAPLAHAEPVSNPVGDKDASRLYQEATSAFGLGHYAEAAEKYEGAFSLRPDPALLYNAAQSYRLAGIKTRAIELYRNYLRLYPLAPNASDARAHVASLQKAIDWDLAHPELVRPPKPAPPPAIKTPAAPVTPLPAAQPSGAPQPTQTRAMPPPQETGTPAKPPPAPAASQPGNEASASLVAEPGAEGDQKPMTKESWFWVSCGAGAVLLGAMVFLFVNRSDTYPDATFGTARGN